MDRNTRRRLQRLERAVRKVGEGDFSARIPESTDTDEIARLERAFNTTVDQVAGRRARFVELDTLKSDFVSNVSHELRTPLTTIKALTRLLLRGELAEEKRREYLETISVECDRQIDLVLNLLDLSRIEGGVFRLSMEKVDVAEIVRSCVKAETRSAERRSHKLEIETIDKILPVCADSKALRRVLSNLIENAIKYTPDGGFIKVFARNDDDLVSIGVKDNGRGIPPEDLPVLFDKFHRGRPAPHSAAMRNATEDAEFLEDADVSGLGLGLYLGKNVIEQMNGTISVETEVGRGSTFTLHLPVWNGESTSAKGEQMKEEKNGEAVARR
jgi:signal transduction histidine kinase